LTCRNSLYLLTTQAAWKIQSAVFQELRESPQIHQKNS
jgi:hypothetical protein